VRALIRFVSRGEYGLREVPPLIKEVIRGDYWKGRRVPFRSFVDFVTSPPLDGLGADVATIKRLCGADAEALDLLDQALTGRQGKRPDLGNNVPEVVGRPEGNTVQKALRRLRKDRPDLHARVLSGELTPHGAMIEAGFRPRTLTVPLTVEGLGSAICRHLSPEQWAALVQLVEATMKVKR
jgi:hypothetical protein